MLDNTPELLKKFEDSRCCSRVLANAGYPYHKLGKWKSTLQMNSLFQINARQLFRPCHVVWVLISGFQYFAICSSGKLYVTKPVSCFNILAGCPVIIKQMWQSPVTRLAVPLLGWICDAYPCPANAIFPQLEFNHTLFERVCRTYSHGRPFPVA